MQGPGEITITISYGRGGKSSPSSAQGFAWFTSDAERDEYLSRFPKSVNVKPTSLSTDQLGDPRGRYPAITFRVGLEPTAGNERNEVGVKRLLQFLNLADATYTKLGGNAYDSLEEALNYIS